MSVSVTTISCDDICRLPSCSPGCRYCLYWKQPNHTLVPTDPGEREALKRAWLRGDYHEVGTCAKLALADSRTAGFAHFGYPRLFPTAKTYTCGSPDESALFVACLFVFEPHVGNGIGTFLLKDICDGARSQGFSAVESFARKRSAENPSGPLLFWLKNGFSIVSEDDDFALVRKSM